MLPLQEAGLRSTIRQCCIHGDVTTAAYSEDSGARESRMPLATYGVTKGTALGHLRNTDNHYQILARADKPPHRIASNVKTSTPKEPSTFLFLSSTSPGSGGPRHARRL